MPGLDGPFITYEFEVLNPYIYLENRKGGIFLTDPSETTEYLEVCEKVRELAYDHHESVKLVESLAKEL